MPDITHCWTEELRDGVSVEIRPMCKQDAKIEQDFIQDLSSSSRWFRFLHELKQPSPDLAKQLTNVDQIKQVALIATVGKAGNVKAIGVARYAIDNNANDCAEFAVAVANSSQRKGLGSLLLNHLIDIARENGIRRLYSINSTENFKVHEIARKFGFESKIDSNDMTRMIHSKNIGRT